MMIKKSKMGKEKSSRKAMLHIIHDYSEYSTIQGIARIGFVSTVAMA
jgi:hypothetical protein